MLAELIFGLVSIIVLGIIATFIEAKYLEVTKRGV